MSNKFKEIDVRTVYKFFWWHGEYKKYQSKQSQDG